MRTGHSFALSVPFLRSKPTAQNSFAGTTSIESLREPNLHPPLEAPSGIPLGSYLQGDIAVWLHRHGRLIELRSKWKNDG